MGDTIYDIFALVSFVTGLLSGAYIVRRGIANFRKDRLLSINFLLLGLATIWIGCVYVATVFAFSGVTLSIGLWIRPGVFFVLYIPAQIIRRLGI